MTAPIPGPQTPEEWETIRHLGIAAEALEIYETTCGTAEYDRLAAGFCRRNKAQDVVSGLILIAQYFGRTVAANPEHYLPMLSAWRRMSELADALAPAVDDDSPD